MNSTSPPRSGPSPLWIATIAAVLGAGAWVACDAATGRREAWDSPLYFAAVMPLLALASGILGFTAPGRAAVIALAMAAGQFAALFAMNGLGSLFPIGIVLFLLFALPSAAAAWVGGRLRRRRAVP